MSVEIKVPTLGESVTEATVAKWFKQVGDDVEADEPIVELETDKVTLELNAPASGSLSEISVEEGGEVEVGAILGAIDENGGGAARQQPADDGAAKEEAAPAEQPAEARGDGEGDEADGAGGDGALSPAVRKLLDEHGIDPGSIKPTGPKGNITKGDVLAAVEAGLKGDASDEQRSSTRHEPDEAPSPGREDERDEAAAGPEDQPARDAGSASAKEDDGTRPAAREERPKAPAPKQSTPARETRQPEPAAPAGRKGREERVKMTRLRRRIAERLKEAQNTAAMLTTYNEADMSAVMALRKRYRDSFEKKHGVRLGFMSFFVKAAVNALQAIPAVNAEIDGDEIVYKHYYDVGVAVGTPSGLVVPVIRDADSLGFAETEKRINELGKRARDGKLGMDELMGGTFTISNGGVYGSLMSSPILNPPQVGILGMHKIQERPMVVEGEIRVRPMMYLALSYDHRIVDGAEAVTFLVRVKECIEDPERLLIDV
ncbi:MAG: 2-oxoglutarate dehydrogenase complex dihydrolipoyllysine-residue succinyltransferase [Geminicoccaceae bacterium]|nr:2-oxoglutarate dehydrogenase complex dihydrolipoyllysine-residue succinyltransferase [Geminicoccaceae bacterium]